MNQIEAAVFDIDGTIINTSEFIIRAHEYTLMHHGLPPRTREEIASQVGKTLEDGYAFLAPGTEPVKLLEIHRAFQADNLHLIQPFEHANDVLSVLSQHIPLALWTARKRVSASLEVAGIDEAMFRVVTDATMYEHGKPNPEGLVLTLGKLGVEASRAVMIGDAAVDILAGKAAGVRATVAVTHGFGTRQELETARPDYIIDSLNVLPDLIDTIGQ